MKKGVDKEEMEKCLKAANIYEENMPDDLMAEYYKAIKDSVTTLHEESVKDVSGSDELEKSVDVESEKNEAEKSLNDSANELLEAISNSESVHPFPKRKRYVAKSDDDDSLDAFSQDILQKSKSKLTQEETNNNNNSIHIDSKQDKTQESDIVLDCEKVPFGFNDMPKSEKEKSMIKIITHELKFVNIQNSKKFLTSNSETRLEALYEYHIAAAKLQAQYARLSTNMAPTGKPITAIDHDIYVNPVISSLKEGELHLDNDVSYVSRSGRLTKRKVYNEYDESSLDSFSTAKRTKGDSEWTSKSTSKEKTSKSVLKRNDSDEINTNSSSTRDKSPNKPHTKIKRTESPDSSQDTLANIVDQFDKVRESTPAHPKPRTYQRKALSNKEIMSKSSLFKDTNASKKGRSAAMVNAAKENLEKKKQQEEEMEKFTNSLDLDSQALDDDDSDKIIIDVEEEVPERRRVVPPVPSSRRPIHGKKRGDGSGAEPLNITAKKPNLNSVREEAVSPVLNGVTRKRANNNNTDRGEPSSSSSSKGKKDFVHCPLCSLSFSQKEIEEHAATCGEDMFPQTTQPKRITCHVCDTVVPFTTDYEVHVNACLDKKKSGTLD